jgi:hypothetical protein
MMYFLLCFLFMCDIFMFVELLNNIFSLFINNVFQSCKIILQYFCLHVRVTHALLLGAIQSASGNNYKVSLLTVSFHIYSELNR